MGFFERFRSESEGKKETEPKPAQHIETSASENRWTEEEINSAIQKALQLQKEAGAGGVEERRKFLDEAFGTKLTDKEFVEMHVRFSLAKHEAEGPHEDMAF